MDEATIEKAGTAPLQPAMKRIAAIKNRQELIEQVAFMHRNGMSALFTFYSQPDMHDSNKTIANLDQGGITLPDRDYYIKDDRQVGRDAAEVSGARAEDVRAGGRQAGGRRRRSQDGARSRDRTGQGFDGPHRAPRSQEPRSHDESAEAEALAPNFDLTQYFAENGSPKFTTLNVGNPDFFKAGERPAQLACRSTTGRPICAGARINDYAPTLTKAFVDEDFEFNGKYLSGQKEIEPRWKRCVQVDRPQPRHGAGPALRRQDLRT